MRVFNGSSANYAATVVPEPAGHVFILLIAAAMAAAIASIALKFGGFCAMLALAPLLALRWQHAGQPASQLLRPDTVSLDASGDWLALSERGVEHVHPVAGTFVLPSFGVLVLRRTDNSEFWLLLRRVNQPGDQWRRFIVLWRLIGVSMVTRDPSC